MRKYLEESINLLLLLEPSRCTPFKHTLKQKQLCLKLIFVCVFFLEGNLLVPCQHAKEEQCKCLTSALLKNLLDTKAESGRLTPTVNGSIWIRNPSDQGSKASDLKWALKNLFKFNDTTSPSDPPDQVQNL